VCPNDETEDGRKPQLELESVGNRRSESFPLRHEEGAHSGDKGEDGDY
jgi:hypothetical protein